ncbi:MAG: hypothetical protein H0U83_06880, partial [Sphingomonas sp.]|nr:hypothetical protein [Sphingomonas sp.]
MLEGAQFVRTPEAPLSMKPAAPVMSDLGRKQTFGLKLIEGFSDKSAGVGDSIERNEAAHARTLAGAEQGFVERPEPVAQGFERVALADFEDDGLDRVARGRGGEGGETVPTVLGARQEQATLWGGEPDDLDVKAHIIAEGLSGTDLLGLY